MADGQTAIGWNCFERRERGKKRARQTEKERDAELRGSEQGEGIKHSSDILALLEKKVENEKEGDEKKLLGKSS
jgi:hypothetical protein